MKVELIFERACPNADGARERLKQAFANCGLRSVWTEWQSDDSRSPHYARHHASPTILVDGRDIAEGVAHDGTSACRLYATSSGGVSGTPELAKIEAALRSAAAGTARPIKRTLQSLPVVGIARLPKLTCAAAGRLTRHFSLLSGSSSTTRPTCFR